MGLVILIIGFEIIEHAQMAPKARRMVFLSTFLSLGVPTMTDPLLLARVKHGVELKAKVAGGHAKASKIYAEFDVVLHRPIPKGAQINNAKLMRRRIGDRFKYTVNFSVRVPAAAKSKAPKHAIGVDIGFRRLLNGAIRAAMIGSTDKNFGFQTVELSKRYVERVNHIEALQSDLDDSAGELGKRLKPLIIAGSVLPEEHAKRTRHPACQGSNRTDGLVGS